MHINKQTSHLRLLQIISPIYYQTLWIRHYYHKFQVMSCSSRPIRLS